jgi:hypothetical protein
MISHSYKVGQNVLFTLRSRFLNKVGGTYEVIRLMPTSDIDGEFQYRLKSPGETHERVASESELRLL